MERQQLLRKVTDPAEKEKILLENKKAMQQIEIEMKKRKEKKYIIMYVMSNDDEERRWMPCTGRDAARDFIKIIVDEIDIKKSLVLVDNVALKNSVNVYTFMKKMAELYDDEFDIEDYN